MWPFRKKTPPKPKITVKSVLCISGFFEDRNEIFVKTNGAYMVAADVLIDMKRERYYTFEITPGNAKVISISAETGNINEAKAFANAGAMLLETGGTCLKVKSAGKAFEKNSWLGLTKRIDELACLYEMFVSGAVIDSKGNAYSCGMHNLGFTDVMVLNAEFNDAVKLIRIFNFYQLVDKPVISAHQTFSMTADSPHYMIKEVIEHPNKGQELLENPFGMWSLERVN